MKFTQGNLNSIGILILSIAIIILALRPVHGQCYSNNGIMNKACASMDIVPPPAIEISAGYIDIGKIVKLDVNYISKYEIVYGISGGIRPFKDIYHYPEDGSINGFIGYNLAGCAIIGATLGYTHYSYYYQNNIDLSIVKKSYFKPTMGMSIKLITMYAPFPITVGAYASTSGIGVTLGSVIPLNNSLWYTIKNIF